MREKASTDLEAAPRRPGDQQAAIVGAEIERGVGAGCEHRPASHPARAATTDPRILRRVGRPHVSPSAPPRSASFSSAWITGPIGDV